MAKVIADLVARGASPAFIRVVAAVVTPQAMRLLNDKFPGTLPRPGSPSPASVSHPALAPALILLEQPGLLMSQAQVWA